MRKRVLLALDLEGVNHVVGEPYLGLGKETEAWRMAVRQAKREIGVAAEALAAAGATVIDLWDNHGGGGNLSADDCQAPLRLLFPDPHKPRMAFAEGAYDAICFFGYHAMEGTLGGVLAHTMNSKKVQHYKLNGRYIGEVDIDSYIAASHGIPACFFAGGDIACSQAARAVPGIVTVVTKYERGRNNAEFRDDGELFAEIGQKIVAAVQADLVPHPLTYPAIFEKSFKRVEDAAAYRERLRSRGLEAEHPEDEVLGRDAHTVVCVVQSIHEFIGCI